MFKRNKNSQRQPTATESDKKSPVMRYYRPDTKPTPAHKTRLSGSDSSSRPQGGNAPKKTPSWLSMLPSWLSVAAIAAVLVANLGLSSTINVGAEDANEVANFRSLNEYKSGMNELLGESILNSTKLTFRSAKFERDLKALYPELSSATVVVPLVGRQLFVSLAFVEPLLRLNSADNRQGIVGKNGVLVRYEDRSALNATVASKLPSISITPQINYEQAEQVLTLSEVQLIHTLLSEADGSEPYRPAVAAIEFNLQKRELFVRFKDENFYAKLTPERESRPQVGALIAVLKQLSEVGETPAEYVDVRVEGRAFVK